jgi:hypothetical protein
MHLQMCGGEEKGRNTRARSLASQGQGGAWRSEVRRGAWVHDVHVNSPSKSSPKPHRPASNQLWDAVTLGRSFLYIRAATTEITTNQQP